MTSDNIFYLTLDTNANIIDFEGIAPSVTGYSASEVKGKNWFETFIPESNIEDITTVFNGFLNGNLSFWEHENEITCKDGTKCLIKWKNTLKRDHANNPSGVTSQGTLI